MGKYNKIKRNRRIFSRRKPFHLPSFIISVVIICLLVGTGWLLYEPIYNIATGNVDFKEPEVQEVNVVPQKQEKDTTTKEEKPKDNIKTKGEVKPKVSNNDIKAVYVSNSVLSSKENLSRYLDKLDKKATNTVLIDVKDSKGYILYNTENEMVKGSTVVKSNPINLSDTVKLIKEKGFIPMARIYAFRDNIIPKIYRAMAVKYLDTDMMWLDNTPEHGGKPWANPYSIETQKYISSIVLEVIDQGFSKVVLDGIQFPDLNIKYANFGENSKTTSKTAVLNSFIKDITKKAKEKNADIYVYTDVKDIVAKDSILFGGNPLDAIGDNVAVGVMINSIPDNYKMGETTIKNPKENAYNTVSSILKYIKTDLKNKNIIVFVDGENNIDSQTKAINESKIQNYVAY